MSKLFNIFWYLGNFIGDKDPPRLLSIVNFIAKYSNGELRAKALLRISTFVLLLALRFTMLSFLRFLREWIWLTIIEYCTTDSYPPLLDAYRLMARSSSLYFCKTWISSVDSSRSDKFEFVPIVVVNFVRFWVLIAKFFRFMQDLMLRTSYKSAAVPLNWRLTFKPLSTTGFTYTN